MAAAGGMTLRQSIVEIDLTSSRNVIGAMMKVDVVYIEP